MHADFEASEELSRENRARSNARFRARTQKPACYVWRGAGYAPFSLFPSPSTGDGAPGSALHQPYAASSSTTASSSVLGPRRGQCGTAT